MAQASTPQIRAVLLDFDDTLINMKQAAYLAFNAALRSHGLRDVRFNEMLANWDRSWKEVVKELAPTHQDVDVLVDKIGKAYFERFGETHLQSSVLLPGTIKVLKTLRAMKLKTAIVSRRRRRIIEEELDKFTIRPYIDTIVSREDVTQMKPAPHGVTLAAEQLQVPIEQCVMVGDSPNDLKAGKAAGTMTAAVLTGPYGIETIRKEKPDIIVDQIADLVAILERHLGGASPEVLQKRTGERKG